MNRQGKDELTIGRLGLLRTSKPKSGNALEARWLTIRDAAALLGSTDRALRRALERRAVRAPDGSTEANLDGVRGRKLGGRWRVLLGKGWQL